MPLEGPEALIADVQNSQNSQNGHPTIEVVPFKVVGQIVAARMRGGKVVGEQVVGELVLYEPEFELLREKIDRAWPEIVNANA
jgi:hypothetical protein